MNSRALADCAWTPWRNGGGRTRELLTWPSADHWLVRVSVADIDANGPFSPFVGIDRCFAVLEGAGVELVLPQGLIRLRAGDAACMFAGEAAPMCRLIDGPTRDLNLMVRRRAGQAWMQRGAPRYEPGLRWRGGFDRDRLWWSDGANALPPLSPDAWHLALIES